MTFYTGQKVVYYREEKPTLRERMYEWLHPQPGGDIERGKVYTVANIITHEDGAQSLELLEVYSPADKWWCAGFKAECFRPLSARPTSIEAFKKELV